MQPLTPQDIKDNSGQPLSEMHLKWLWLESPSLGRRITALELLSLPNGPRIKTIYVEASDALTRCNDLCNASHPSAPDWHRLDINRLKARKFYKVAQQVHRIRREQAGIPKGNPVDFIVDKLAKQAQDEGWSPNLLHMRTTRAIEALHPRA